MANKPPTETKTYRADIDGLRAVAVLAVIFYHAGNNPFTGGYLGVDIFFVISGFLITGLIVNDLRADRFSLVTFYERRIRRIFPAYFTVVVVVGLVGAWLYDARTFQELWTSLLASTLSFANLLFYSQAGYFDGPSLLKPMLHTWSLSVEEQFYLFLPLLLFLIFKYARRWLVPLLALVLFGSFSWSVITVQGNREAAFYLPHLRAWELLVGALCVLYPIRLKVWIQNLLAILGLGGIMACLVFYSETTVFPGLTALVPVLGTALIINSGSHGQNLIGKLLGFSPLVFIGKISYSLYLWHWPLLVMARYYLITDMSPRAYLVWIVLTFVLSTFTWKFVETPFRERSFLPRPRIFVFSGTVAGLILVLAFVVIQTKGLPERIDLTKTPPPEVWNSRFADWEICQDPKNVTRKDCQIGLESKKTTFLIWGNSHAHSFAPGFDQAARNAQRSGLIIWKGGCPPILGLGEAVDQACNQFNQDVSQFIVNHPELETVILAASWNPGELTDDLIKQTLGPLIHQHKKIYITAPFPEIKTDVPAAYFIANRTGRDANALIAPTLKEFMNPRNKRIFDLLQMAETNYTEVHILYLANAFCDTKNCKVIENNLPLYMDKGHLSTIGATLLISKFEEIFRVSPSS